MIPSSKQKVCTYCGKEIEYEPCPYCKRISGNRQNPPNTLKIGCVLGGKYIIQDVIGSGGFGITYLAYHFQAHRYVAVKELFPKEMVTRARDGYHVALCSEKSMEGYRKVLDRFKKEAELVKSLSGHPGIVRVEELFTEYYTFYMVMEYLDGMDLRHYLFPSGAGYMNRLNDGQLLFLMLKVAESLDYVHNVHYENGIVLHRDIAPDNIFLCSDGSVKLIDFGAARNIFVYDVQNGVSVIIKGGFTPIEQYSRKGNQGPWTDIYSLGATAFYSATGKLLEAGSDNTELLNMLKKNSALYRIIRKCTELQLKNRYQTARQLLADLKSLKIEPIPFYSVGSQVDIHSEDDKKTTAEHTGYTAPGPGPKKLLWLIFGATALTVLLVIIVIMLFMSALI